MKAILIYSLIFIFFLSFIGLKADVNKKLDSILKEAYKSRNNQDLFRLLNEYLKISIDNNLLDKKAQGYYELTRFSWLKGFYSDALDYSQKAIQQFSINSNDKGIGNTFLVLGNIYTDINDTSKAFYYYNRALKIFKETKEIKLEAIIYGNLANCYNNCGNLEKTMYNSNKAIKIFKNINDKIGVADNYTNIGDVLYKNQKYDESLNYYFKSFDLYNSTNDSHRVCLTYISIGLTYHKLKKMKRANDYISKGIELSNRFNFIDEKPLILKELIYYFKDIKDFKNALLYSESLSAWKDTISKYSTSSIEKKFELQRLEEKNKNEKLFIIKEQESKNQFFYFSLIFSILIIIGILIILIIVNS